MKPKTRYPQKQERRLYLRNNDHRDIVLNDAYVNALWLKKDDKDELVWQRYPREYVIMKMRQTSGYPVLHYLTVLDTDREFAHSVSWSNNYGNSQLWKLEDIVVIHYEYQTTSPFVVSFNGLNWATMNPSVEEMENYRKFTNDNGLCSCWWSTTGVNQVTFYVVHFEIDEETKDIAYYSSSFNIIFPEIVNRLHYICDTANGMLVAVSHSQASIKNVSIYEIIPNQAILCKILPTDSPSDIVSASTKGCRKGSFYAMCWHESFREGSVYMNNVVVSVSNNKTDWTPTTIFRRSSGSGYSTPRFEICSRNGWFYVYIVSDNVLHAYKSDTGLEWIELNLLDYVDVNCITDGSFVSPSIEKIRVILNPNGDIPQDSVISVNAGELVDTTTTYDVQSNRIQNNFNNVMFTDGEFENGTHEYLGLSGWVSGIPCVVYFDNMIFASSEGNYALISNSYVESRGFENIMEGDYCVEYVGHTYPYWNPTIDYVIDDIVTYGTLWKCKSANTNTPPTESVYWTKYREGE